VITELEFKSLAAAGLQPHPAHQRGLCRPRDAAVAVPQAGRRQPHSFLLESVVGGERFGRYSFIGLPARTLLRASGNAHRGRHRRPGGRAPRGQPAGLHRAYQQRFKVALRPGLPRFCGGLAGYFGYDAVRYIEKKLAGPGSPAASARPTSCCCRPRNWRSSTTCRAGCT
jgi:anthranilate synthase component 1